MHIQTGINSSSVFKIDELPVDIFAEYQKLDTVEVNGSISSPLRASDLIMTIDVAGEVLTSLRIWIGSIISTQKITVSERPDHPYELTVSISAPGMNYNIEMETLDQTIIWDSAAETFTMSPRQAFDLSIEAFIYYLDTLDDLLNAVKNLP